MPTARDSESKRRSSGRTDQPLEDELVEEFQNTVQEGADRLHRTWRALIITGLFGGIDDPQTQTRALAHPVYEVGAVLGRAAGLGGDGAQSRRIDALAHDPLGAQGQGVIGPIHGARVQKARP